MSRTTTGTHSIIGQHAIIRDVKGRGTIVEGCFIDEDEDHKPKRIRLETGEHAGEVRQGKEYQILELVEHSEAAGCLAMVWQD